MISFRTIGLVVFVLTGCSAGQAEQQVPADYVVELTSSKTGAPGEWGRWRGPKYDGISTETDWSHEWPEEGPKSIWKAAVGTGFSSISVAGGRAYTMGHKSGEETIFCFDAVTGKKIWSHTYKCALIDKFYEGGPSCMPTVDGDRVFTVGKEGQFFCLDAASGDVKWSANLPKEMEIETPEWGFSSPPLVLGNLVIVDGGRTAAYDKASGKIVWKTEKFRPGYGAPISFEMAGETRVAVLNNDCLLIVRAKDGSVVASEPWETNYATSATTPIIHDNTFFISTGYNQGCALVRLKEDKFEAVYDNKLMRNHMNTCVLWKGTLFGIDGQSNNSRGCHLVAMDHATGEVKWKERSLGCGSLIMADGKLIALSDEGKLVIVEANAKEYKELASASILTGLCWSPPTLADGRLYARNSKGDVVCVDLRSKR